MTGGEGGADPLAPIRAASGPLVFAQLGTSLDGRIATVTGQSHYINGPEALEHVHRLRAAADAVVVGAGTVAADDPRLTVRRVDGRNPVRVVLDPLFRLAADRRVFTDGAAPTLVVGIRPPDGDGPAVPGCARALALDAAADGRLEPAAILAALAARGLARVFVEGGGLTVSRFLAAGVLDRLHLLVAPLLIGSGRPGLVLPPIEDLAQARRPPARVFALGADTLFDLDLRQGQQIGVADGQMA